MTLDKIKTILEKNRYYSEHKIEHGLVPYPCLKVLLEDQEAEDYYLQLGFIPGIDDQLDHHKLMQFFVPIVSVDGDTAPDISQFLHEINKELALPAFVIDLNAELIYYRYTLPIPHDISANFENQFIEIVELIFFQIVQFANAIKLASVQQ